MRALCPANGTMSETACFILGEGGHVFSGDSVKRLHLKKNNGRVRDTVLTKTTNCFMNEE